MTVIWKEVRASSKIPLHLEAVRDRKYYFNKPKMEAKAMFYYYVGELNFRTNRSRESKIKYGGVQCLVGTCGGEDSLQHITVCHGYRTRPPPNMREEDLCQYLLEIHRERIQRWSAPLMSVDVTSILSS